LPGRAIPALQRIHLEKGLLDRVECVSLGEPLGSSDLCAVVGNRERQADDGPPTVEQDGARAALTVVAALLRRGHSEPISKRVQEGRASVNDYRSILTVHSQGDLCIHPTLDLPTTNRFRQRQNDPASRQMHATSRGDACRSRILHHVDVCGALTDWPTTGAEALESCARPQVSVAPVTGQARWVGTRAGRLRPGPARNRATTLRWQPGRTPCSGCCSPPTLTHTCVRAGAGVFLDQSDPFRSGWPAAWTESPPTSSPPGVATTTNRTRTGLDDAGITEDRCVREAKKAVNAAEKTLRDAQARAARRPRGPGEAAAHGPGLSPQPVAASTFCQIRGSADRSGSRGVIWQKVAGKARRWPRPAARPRPA
jgi:hypothetical protein